MQESVPASPEAAEVQAEPADPFALDEQSDNPAEALESMRHNCCDEMPAEELREHTDHAAAPAKTYPAK
ncbi:MAG TPA: hypothetical protein VFN67_07250 [Polyangiales bacterium]|nr:hypothetical protein [Polyangiales bacterium]